MFQPVNNALGVENVCTRQPSHFAIKAIPGKKVSMQRGMRISNPSLCNFLPFGVAYSSRHMQHSRLDGSMRSSGATRIVGSCRIARSEAGGAR
jgi:hypothetical protein